MSKDVRAVTVALLIKMAKDMGNLAVQTNKMSHHLLQNADLILKYVETLEQEGWPMPGPSRQGPNAGAGRPSPDRAGGGEAQSTRPSTPRPGDPPPTS